MTHLSHQLQFEQLLLDFIRKYIDDHGIPPTQAEAAEALGVSRSRIQKSLNNLEKSGKIQIDRNIARGIRLPTYDHFGSVFRIPVVGVIQAGEPIPIPASEFNPFTKEDTIDISASLMPKTVQGNDLFAIHVQGDSMIDALINDGDLIILQSVENFENGEMAAVWLSDRNETTLKFIYKEKDHYRLQPANPTMKPIYISHDEPLEVKGKVVMVIRRFESQGESEAIIKWRLDAAVPNQVQTGKSFDIGVLICPDTVPQLNVEDLPKVKSAVIHPTFDEKQPYMQIRVEIQSPDCKIHGENPRHVRVSKDNYSPIYFQLTPNLKGLISIVVSVFQEMEMLGNTRVRTEAIKEVGNVKVEVSSMELDSNPVYENEVFVSYAWGGESERMVDELEKVFTKRGLFIVRDKKDLDYRGSIKEFEQRIGCGQCVVLVISKKYLESENCMYELVEIDENKDFRQRVFPIVLADAEIYKSKSRIAYIRYWDKRIKELNKELKSVDRLTHLDGFTDELNLFDRIRSKFDHLSKLLSDMNALTPEIHAATGFSILIKQVESTLKKELIS